MQHMDVQAIVDRVKTTLGVKTDLELATRLEIPRATIASWKRRGSIPTKYLAYMTAEGMSLDWILYGKSDDTLRDEYGFLQNEEKFIDHEALWISIMLMVRELRQSELLDMRVLGEKITKKDCMEFHIKLTTIYPKVMNSKGRWLGSGLVDPQKVYSALAVEYDLGDFDFHALPWWEDEELC